MKNETILIEACWYRLGYHKFSILLYCFFFLFSSLSSIHLNLLHNGATWLFKLFYPHGRFLEMSSNDLLLNILTFFCNFEMIFFLFDYLSVTQHLLKDSLVKSKLWDKKQERMYVSMRLRRTSEVINYGL